MQATNQQESHAKAIFERVFGHPYDPSMFQESFPVAVPVETEHRMFTYEELSDEVMRATKRAYAVATQAMHAEFENRWERINFFKDLYETSEKSLSLLQDEFLQLESTNQDLQAKNRELYEKNQELLNNHKTKMTRIRVSGAELRGEIMVLKEKHAMLEEDKTALAGMCSEQQSQILKLRAELSGHEGAWRQVQRTLATLSTQSQRSAGILSLVESNVEPVVRPAQAAQVSLGISAECQTDFEQAVLVGIETQTDSMQVLPISMETQTDFAPPVSPDGLADLERQLTAEKDKSQMLHEICVENEYELENKTARVIELEQGLDAETARVQDLTQRLDAETARVQDLTQRLDAETARAARTERIHQADLRRFETEKAQFKGEAAHLKDKVKQVKSQIETVKTTIKASFREEYAKAIKDFTEVWSQETKRLSNGLSDLHDHCMRLKFQVKSFVEVQEAYEETKTELEKTNDELEDARSAYAELVKEHKDLQDLCCKYAEKKEKEFDENTIDPRIVAELHTARIAFKDLSAQAITLGSENTKLMEENTKLKAKNTDLDAENRNLYWEAQQARMILAGLPDSQKHALLHKPLNDKKKTENKLLSMTMCPTSLLLHEDDQPLLSLAARQEAKEAKQAKEGKKGRGRK